MARDLVPDTTLASKRISRTGDVLASLLGSRASFSTSSAQGDRSTTPWSIANAGHTGTLQTANALSSPALLQPANPDYFTNATSSSKCETWQLDASPERICASTPPRPSLKSPFAPITSDNDASGSRITISSNDKATRGLFGSPSMPLIAGKVLGMSNVLLSPCTISASALPGAFPTPPQIDHDSRTSSAETPDAPPPLKRVQDSLPRFPTPDDIKKRETLVDLIAKRSPAPGNDGSLSPEGTPELVFSSPLRKKEAALDAEDSSETNPSRNLGKRKSLFGLRTKGRKPLPLPLTLDSHLASPVPGPSAGSPVSPLAGRCETTPALLEAADPKDVRSSPVPSEGSSRPRKPSLSHRLSTIFKAKREKSEAPPTPVIPDSHMIVPPNIRRSISSPEVFQDPNRVANNIRSSRVRPDLMLKLEAPLPLASGLHSPTTTASTRPSSLFETATLPSDAISDCSSVDGTEMGVAKSYPVARTSSESEFSTRHNATGIEVLSEAFTLQDHNPSDAEILRSISASHLGGLDEAAEDAENSTSEDDRPLATLVVPRSLSTPVLGREQRSMQRSLTTGQLRSPKGNSPSRNPFAFESAEMSKVPIPKSKIMSPSAPPRRKLSTHSQDFTGHSLLPQSDRIASQKAPMPLPSFVQDSVLSFSDDESGKADVLMNRSKSVFSRPSNAVTHATVTLPGGRVQAIMVEARTRASDILAILSSRICHQDFPHGACLLLRYMEEDLSRILAPSENVHRYIQGRRGRPCLSLVSRPFAGTLDGNGFFGVINGKRGKRSKRWFSLVQSTKEGSPEPSVILCMSKGPKDKKVSQLCSLNLFDIFLHGHTNISLRSKVDDDYFEVKQDASHEIAFDTLSERDAAFYYLDRTQNHAVTNATRKATETNHSRTKGPLINILNDQSASGSGLVGKVKVGGTKTKSTL